MALSLQQEQQSQDLQWEQLPEGISDLELAKKLQEEEDRRASQYYQEQEQEQAAAAAAAAAQAQVGTEEGSGSGWRGEETWDFVAIWNGDCCTEEMCCTSAPELTHGGVRTHTGC